MNTIDWQPIATMPMNKMVHVKGMYVSDKDDLSKYPIAIKRFNVLLCKTVISSSSWNSLIGLTCWANLDLNDD